jgi:hypothetical protein
MGFPHKKAMPDPIPKHLWGVFVLNSFDDWYHPQIGLVALNSGAFTPVYWRESPSKNRRFGLTFTPVFLL